MSAQVITLPVQIRRSPGLAYQEWILGLERDIGCGELEWSQEYREQAQKVGRMLAERVERRTSK